MTVKIVGVYQIPGCDAVMVTFWGAAGDIHKRTVAWPVWCQVDYDIDDTVSLEDFDNTTEACYEQES